MELSPEMQAVQAALSNSTPPGAPSVGSATNKAASAILGQAQLGKDDFLKLLVAQLENQDPLNPTNNEQMMVQTAQFSQIEQLTKVVTLLERMVELQEAQQEPVVRPSENGAITT
ncbi:MAG: flagellar hook assembly protein FlgD [Nitrospiraceae bacterium]